MATNLQYITRAVSGVGNPTDGDRLVRDITTFRINNLYVNKTDGSVWVRKAINGVAADWETMEGGGGSGSPSYLVYSALLTQSGTNAPIVESNGSGPNTPFENTLVGAIVWTYSSQGYFIGTLAGAFTLNKCLFFITPSSTAVCISMGWDNALSPDAIFIQTNDSTNDAPVNGVLNKSTIEIRVYP